MMLQNPELSDSEIIEILGNKWLYEMTEAQKSEYKIEFEKKFRTHQKRNSQTELNFHTYSDYAGLAGNCANPSMLLKENQNLSNEQSASNALSSLNKFKLKYKSAFKLFKLANVIELKEQYPNLDCR